MASLVPLVFLAVVLAFLYESSDSLLTPIATHSMFNAANFFYLVFHGPDQSLAASLMNEFELIAQWTRSLPANASVIVGAGDDCAVLDSGQPGRYLSVKTDAVVQGIHFPATAEPEQIGHKALGRCLSDIAAMAGRPIAALVTMALPSHFEPRSSKHLRRHEPPGEATRGGHCRRGNHHQPGTAADLGLSAGRCRRGQMYSAVRGEKEGDALFVTGELGGSLAGKHLEFEPRLAEARWLAGHFPIHAMIDLSDGLAGDLRHLLRRSGVGAEILARAIPISRAARLQARAGISGQDPAPGRVERRGGF